MRAKRFVAWQTFDGVCLAINELCALIDYFSEPQFQEKHGRGAFIIPKRISQDIVESYFSLQRSSCGGNTNMTAYTYGHSTQQLILHHVARKNNKRKTMQRDWLYERGDVCIKTQHCGHMNFSENMLDII